MIQNIKVDTIYYLTNSDFEMEFNLCGCCKMRLLTDKAENAKNFVGLLSRAVSRSQVILCCGKLFSNDGLINIVAKAIKKPLVTVNNATYGIADSNEIKIIDGAVPLVNSDGCFCGCIAESGPQSIILLTDNKGLRKTVLKQLIHPYIEELSIIRNTKETEVIPQPDSNEILESIADETAVQEEIAEVTEGEISAEMLETLQTPEIFEDEQNENAEEIETVDEAQTPEDADTDSEVAANDMASETEPTSENTETEENQVSDSQNDAEENNQDFNLTEGLDKIEDFVMPEVIVDEAPEVTEPTFIDPSEINSGFELYLEPERVKYSKKSHYALNYIPSERDKEFISESSDAEFFEEEEKQMLNLPIMIVIIVLLVALAALAYLLIFIPMRSDYVFSEYIKNIFSVAVNFKPML